MHSFPFPPMPGAILLTGGQGICSGDQAKLAMPTPDRSYMHQFYTLQGQQTLCIVFSPFKGQPDCKVPPGPVASEGASNPQQRSYFSAISKLVSPLNSWWLHVLCAHMVIWEFLGTLYPWQMLAWARHCVFSPHKELIFMGRPNFSATCNYSDSTNVDWSWKKGIFSSFRVIKGLVEETFVMFV